MKGPLLIAAVVALGDGTDPRLDALYEDAVRDTIEQFEDTGSTVITDGEQRKYHNFATYCVKIRSRVEGTALAEETINGR